MRLLSIFTTQSIYTKQARLAAILWTLLIFIACLWPGDEIPKVNIRLIDKWVHFIIFGGFSFLWLCAYPRTGFRHLLLIFLIGCGLGYFVEILQGAFPKLGRSKDMWDALADSIGSLLGVILFWIIASISDKKK